MLFKSGSISQFRDAITEFTNMSESDIMIYKKNSRENILENFNYANVAKSFSDVMIKAFNNFKKQHRNFN